MNASPIKDLQYEWYFKILSRISRAKNFFRDCNLKEFQISQIV